MAKVIKANDNIKLYIILARKHIKSGDHIRGLDYFLRAYETDKTKINILLDIARNYADMGLYTLSNKYLYKFLDLTGKEGLADCYEELAINFFYLENLWASSYYFHEKVKIDGFINSEGLDSDITEFLSDNNPQKGAYFIAYPFEKADYSFRLKAAKRALVFGDYNASSYIYASIPKECMGEDEDGELALSYFLTGRDDEMLKVCHNSLEKHGENVTAYCNLSSFYREKKDKAKCEYYYNKALQSRKGNDDEAYKIATCAIEMGDNITSKECLTKIIDDRVYDDTMLYFRGIANYNLGLFHEAVLDFKKAVMIDPTEMIYQFYAKIAIKADNGETKESFSPLKYVKDFPEIITNKYKKIIKETASGIPPKKLNLDELFEIIKWGLKYGQDKTTKECFYIISAIRGEKSFSFLKELLILPDIREEIKSLALMTLITNGCKDKVGIVTGPFFVKAKPRKMVFDKKPDGDIFCAGYAVCFAKCVFSGVEELDKIAFAVNNIYKEYKQIVLDNDIKTDELASLIMCSAGIKKIKGDKEACRFFGVNYEKIKKYISLVKGEQNDKNN